MYNKYIFIIHNLKKIKVFNLNKLKLLNNPKKYKNLLQKIDVLILEFVEVIKNEYILLIH